MSLLWNLWGALSFMQICELAIFGERAYQTTAHRCRRMAVLWARIVVVWFAILWVFAWATA